jgi:pre-mRNA-splicing factor CDC5/CEF1
VLLSWANDQVVSVQKEFEGVRAEMEKEAIRAAKLEQRMGVLTKGYVTREAALRKELESLWAATQDAERVRMHNDAPVIP